ncbi:NETR-like protein, partial [Mya arenaria]
MQQDTRVQLRNGINRYKGRVEFQYNGIKGTICSEHFDDKDALVVCRAANIPGNQYVELRPHTPIRLTNGTKYSGRVEIEYEGKWGTICDRDFDENDAKVICRMLGYNTRSVEVKQNAYYGIGDGHIIISNLACDGNEPDISECLTAGYKWSAVHGYCTAKNDAAVQCRATSLVRLVSEDGQTTYKADIQGKASSTGRVEVFYMGKWGTICDDLFDNQDSQVLCAMMGYSIGRVNKSSYNNFYGDGNTVIDDLECAGVETDISQCKSREWGTHNCIRQENVFIDC